MSAGPHHAYTALSGCERPTVYPCTRRSCCEGCAQADPLYRTEDDAYAYVEEWEQHQVDR